MLHSINNMQESIQDMNGWMINVGLGLNLSQHNVCTDGKMMSLPVFWLSQKFEECERTRE